jgi:hypothetical protein
MAAVEMRWKKKDLDKTDQVSYAKIYALRRSLKIPLCSLLLCARGALKKTAINVLKRKFRPG